MSVNNLEDRDSELEIPVSSMFDGRSVFITGASGFIGRVLLEKLLRSYPGIKRIYILMRSKKNLQPRERLNNQLLKVPIFDMIREMDKNSDGSNKLLDKVELICGDIGEPNLGISDQDMDRLLSDDTLSIVFHSAATIKFDEPLRISVKLNLIATRSIVEFCRKLKNLISLCHVSTAYVNSHMDENVDIEERLYEMSSKPDQLIELAQFLDEDLMQSLKPKLIGKRPNTYTYTKALAEHYIVSEASDLPVAIVRPSIVVASWQEPVPGWVDNLNGPTGLILAIGKGLLRTMHVKRSVVADVVPVDVVVNTMIASAYYVAKQHKTLPHKSLESKTGVSEELKPMKVETNAATDNVSSSSSNNNNSSSFETLNEENVEGSLNESIVGLTSSEQTLVRDKNCNFFEASSGVVASQNGLANGCFNRKRKQAIGLKSNADNKCVGVDKTVEDGRTIIEPFIVHCNSGDLKPITWGEMEDAFFPIIRKYPSAQVLRYPFGSFKGNKYHDLFFRIFAHFLPALIIDMFFMLMGKKRQLLSIYFKLHGATAALSHFCTHNYKFKSKNIKILRESLLKHDRQELNMDIERLVWWDFWDNYVLGARRYVLKESDDSLKEARKSFKRAYFIEIALRMLMFTACWFLILSPTLRLLMGSTLSLGGAII